MKPAGPIEAAWEGYAKRVMPPDAGRTQLREARRAFFSGAAALFAYLAEGVSDGDKVVQADMDMMQGIADDLQAFADGVRGGTR